jgi:tetratricopeptide (TPR) repeat protein
MTTDARGNPVSTDDAAALEAFERALVQYQTYVGDPIATIDAALAQRPDFVMGHVFRAGALMTFAEARFAAMARESQTAAEHLAARANARERALIAATRLLVDGAWGAACTAYDRVLVEYPRDAFAIQVAHLFDFLRGDAKNLRDRITRVLPAWSANVPGYSYLLGMHAFGLEECNQYPEARATAERALAIEPRDGWSVHAATHCYEMQGHVDEGIAFMTARRADWDDSGFAYHLWWHLGLFHLDRGDTPNVLELFDTLVFPASASDTAYQLLDGTSLLWRLFLAGVDVRARAERLATVWAMKTSEQGFYAFNDVHALLAYVMAERTDAIRAVLAALESSHGEHANVAMSREVGLPVARGVVAFAEGHYDRALAQLEDVRDRAHHFGGSHAQRDLLTLTIIEAALRGNYKTIARHYLGERIVQRPASGLGRRLHARAA